MLQNGVDGAGVRMGGGTLAPTIRRVPREGCHGYDRVAQPYFAENVMKVMAGRLRRAIGS